MRSYVTLFVVACCLTVSHALSIQNSDFESLPVGDGWTGVNSAVSSNYNGLAACEGTYSGYMSNSNGSTNTFLGLNGNASEIFRSNDEIATEITFCYNFFSDEPTQAIPFNDLFELRLVASGGLTQTFLVADVFSSTFNTGNAPTNYTHSTGWQMKTIDISSFTTLLSPNQNVNVFFQVVDAGDLTAKSGAGIDSITLTVVPEPATMSVVAAGLIALGLKRRRK